MSSHLRVTPTAPAYAEQERGRDVGREVAARLVVGMLLTLVVAGTWLALAGSTYTATSSVYVRSGITDAAAAYQLGIYEQNRVQTYATLARSSLVTTAAVERSGLDVSPKELAQHVSVQVLPLTVIVAITVEDPDATRARDLSIALAETVAERGNQLEEEGSAGTSPVRLEVFDEADVPRTTASPDRLRIALLAALGATLVALAVPQRLLERRSRPPVRSRHHPRHANGAPLP